MIASTFYVSFVGNNSENLIQGTLVYIGWGICLIAGICMKQFIATGIFSYTVYYFPYFVKLF